MLILVGSRRDGNSLNLAKEIKKTLDESRIHSEIIVPGNQRIKVCTGCMDCDKDGVCDFTDDMEKNIEKIKQDNIIMFITPTRWNILSGDLKIFMDRLNPLYSRKELKGKKMIAVSIAAAKKDSESSTSALRTLESFAESAQMEIVLKKTFNECLNPQDILNNNDLQSFIDNVKKECKK